MNRFKEYHEQLHPTILRETKQLSREWRKDLLSEISIPEYLLPTLQWFSMCGQGLRGSLLYLANESFNSHRATFSTPHIKKFCALVELLQNALLVHDDVMDNSNWRRNNLSVPAECAAKLHAHRYHDPEKKGVAISLAMSDHLLSWIQQYLINTISIEKSTTLQTLFSKYQTQTMAGQIQDVANLELTQSKETIINLYGNKTGAYTFILPFAFGYASTVQHPDFSIILLLECIGQSLGVIMQGIDDEAGFKRNTTSYHELASDLENHQPSLWLSLLTPQLNDHEKSYLERIWWGGMVTRTEADFVRSLYEKYKIHDQLVDIYRTEARLAHELINELDLEPTYNRLWHGLVQFVVSR